MSCINCEDSEQFVKCDECGTVCRIAALGVFYCTKCKRYFGRP